MNFLVLTLFALVLAALQSVQPTWWWAGGLRVEFLPALVACASLTLGKPRTAILFAAIVGLAHDAMSAAPFGITAIGYCAAAAILAASQESLERELPWMQLGAGAFVSFCGGIVALVASGFFSIGAVMKLAVLAFLSALVTPLIFAAVDALRREPAYE